jgi:P27 family predicted phage terminase small subunit
MKPGRKPLPSYLKAITGNPGRRPLNQHEPQPAHGIPIAPLHLSGGARRAWSRLANELNRMGVLTVADQWALEQLAENYSEILDHREVLKKGRYQNVRTTNGSKKKFLTQRRSCSATLRSALGS